MLVVVVFILCFDLFTTANYETCSDNITLTNTTTNNNKFKDKQQSISCGWVTDQQVINKSWQSAWENLRWGKKLKSVCAEMCNKSIPSPWLLYHKAVNWMWLVVVVVVVVVVVWNVGSGLSTFIVYKLTSRCYNQAEFLLSSSSWLEPQSWCRLFCHFWTLEVRIFFFF